MSAILDDAPKISIINKIELLSFSDISSQLLYFTEEALVIPLNDQVVAKTIELRRRYKIKLPDAVITATALVFNLCLITHNLADFKKIEELNIIDSYFIH